MSIFYAYCSREIGGWCTPKVTLEGPAAIFRYCHLQSALCAEVIVTDTEDFVVAHARGVLIKIPQPDTSFKYYNLLDGREVPDGAGVFHQEREQEGHNDGNPQAGRDA